MPISAKLLSKIKNGKFKKKELLLEDKQINSKELQELVDCINTCPSINSLDLSNSLENIGEEGYKALSELKHIKTLNLSSNEISVEEIKLLNKNTVLDTLYLERCYLQLEHMTELAKHPSVKHLHIPFNGMWSNFKTDCFKDNEVIIELDIGSNSLQAEDLEELSNNKTIAELCLYQNILKDDCVEKLLKMPSLTHVDLRGNHNMTSKAVTFLYSELSKRPKPIEGIDEKKIAHDKLSI